MKKGRKPSTEPALAWDYRRALALVQVLAMENPSVRYAAIGELARVWGLESGHIEMDWMLIHRLAKHALEAARENVDDATYNKLSVVDRHGGRGE